MGGNEQSGDAREPMAAKRAAADRRRRLAGTVKMLTPPPHPY